jgi:type IV pilus assembly protein PilY1
MIALPRTTTNVLALAAAALLLIIPTIADAMPVIGDPPPAPLPGDDAGGDDLFLLQSAVAPNVVLFMDNSDSMNQIEWHPAFDPDKVPDSTYCLESSEFSGVLDPDIQYIQSQDEINASCDNPSRGNRTVYFVQHPDDTNWDGRYLMWYLGLDEGDLVDSAILDDIDNAVADVDGCTQAGGSKFFAEKYRRTRFEATKQVLLDLLCIAEPKNVRFGAASFREVADVGSVDPNGGYVSEDLGRSNPNHAAELESSISNQNPVGTDGTPLAETLFQIYTYWMPRVAADMPLGENGNPFPIYEYNKFGLPVASGSWFEDTMIYDCEKAFVIIVTDGQPNRDTFDSDPTTTALGFSDFGTGGATGLIGDYHTGDGETEEIGDADETAYYLDDISKYMYDKDFRPDLDGNQTIDTYVVGFATGDPTNPTNVYLKKVAELGNGEFYAAKDGDQLIFALVGALNDIIEKAASFTAATVPSARTADGADFYQSYFFPRGSTAFWEGHIRAWTIDAAGAIKGNESPTPLCALEDPTPGECNSGPFRPQAIYFWDAADEIPLPDNRALWVSKSGAMTEFKNDPVPAAPNITYGDLTLDAFAVPPAHAPNSPLYAVKGSTALNAQGLADEIVQYVRGCFFSTGVVSPSTDVATPSPCAERPSRLGDVFHSNAIAIRQPRLRISDTGYDDFKDHYAGRDRLLYAGTNGGFLEAFDTGSWLTPDPSTGRDGYDRGTGVEQFGFMPWEARTKIKNLVIDDPTSRNNYVDGDVNSADVWIDSDNPGILDAGFNRADGSEWRTYLLGALREGGHHFYALDVTNPNQIVEYGGGGGTIPFPDYVWEFPPEGLPTTGDRPFIGETWSKPIITKVKLKDVDRPGDTVDRWVAIVTGGYDNTGDPNPTEVTGTTGSYEIPVDSVRGRGIYIIDLRTGGVLAEKKFDPALLPAPNPEHQPGMDYAVVSTPAVFDLDFDGAADVIYVGDMGGNVWKWVIHNPGEDRINDGSGSREQDVAQWPFKKFFEAASADIGGVIYYKNFMFPPAAAFLDGVLYIGFGSGERRNLTFGGDTAATTENNRFYVMIDSDKYEVQSPALPTLYETDLTDFSGTAAAQSFANKGYYITVTDGEKFVTNVEIFNGDVIAATFIPTTNVNPCTTRGQGTLYIFDLKSGEGHFVDGSGDEQRWMALGSGLPTDPKISCGPGGKDCKVIIEKQTDIDIVDEDPINLNGATLYWREND